jgi:hypothetical protein
MNRRYRHVAALLLAMALVLAGASAQAQPRRHRPASPMAADSVRWQFGRSSPFAGTRFDGEFVASVKRVYFLGFRTTADATDGSVWYYDAVTKTYTDTGVDMPVPISNYGIAALRDAHGLGLYIFGGRDANANIRNTVQVFYPADNTTRVIKTDKWPGMTPLGCVSLPAMGVAVVENKAYVLGGLSVALGGCSDDNSAQTWVFDPTAPAGSRWTQGPDLNKARGYITPAVLAGRIYAIGGDRNQGGTLFAAETVEAWTPGGPGWNNNGVADLPEGCDESQAFAFASGPLAGQIVLATCGQWPDGLPTTYQYDSVGNTWAAVGAVNDNRRNEAGAAFRVNGKVNMYILGGYGEASQFIDPIQTSEFGKPGPIMRPAVPSGDTVRSGRTPPTT